MPVIVSSREVRAVLKAEAEREERLGTRAPYSCRKDGSNGKKLVVDEEAAAVVRRIFAMCATGGGPSQITRQLGEGPCPTTFAYLRFGISHVSLNTERPYHWTSSAV